MPTGAQTFPFPNASTNVEFASPFDETAVLGERTLCCVAYVHPANANKDLVACVNYELMQIFGRCVQMDSTAMGHLRKAFSKHCRLVQVAKSKVILTEKGKEWAYKMKKRGFNFGSLDANVAKLASNHGDFLVHCMEPEGRAFDAGSIVSNVEISASALDRCMDPRSLFSDVPVILPVPLHLDPVESLTNNPAIQTWRKDTTYVQMLVPGCKQLSLRLARVYRRYAQKPEFTMPPLVVQRDDERGPRHPRLEVNCHEPDKARTGLLQTLYPRAYDLRFASSRHTMAERHIDDAPYPAYDPSATYDQMAPGEFHSPTWTKFEHMNVLEDAILADLNLRDTPDVTIDIIIERFREYSTLDVCGAVLSLCSRELLRRTGDVIVCPNYGRPGNSRFV